MNENGNTAWPGPELHEEKALRDALEAILGGEEKFFRPGGHPRKHERRGPGQAC